jgi:hypothetical protein
VCGRAQFGADPSYSFSFAFFSSGFGPPARRLWKRWSVSNQNGAPDDAATAVRSRPWIRGQRRDAEVLAGRFGPADGQPRTPQQLRGPEHPGPGIRYDHEIAVALFVALRSPPSFAPRTSSPARHGSTLASAVPRVYLLRSLAVRENRASPHLLAPVVVCHPGGSISWIGQSAMVAVQPAGHRGCSPRNLSPINPVKFDDCAPARPMLMHEA